MRISDWSSDVCSSDLVIIGSQLVFRSDKDAVERDTVPRQGGQGDAKMVAPLVQDVAERRRESGKGGIAQVAHHIELREGHALAIDLYRDRIGEGWDEQGCAADLARRAIPGEKIGR